MGLDTKTDWVIDRQSQCDFDFDFEQPNTSTMTLWVVGGDKKGSLKSETVKYRRESQGPRAQERLCWQGPVAYIKDKPVLSSERAPHKNKTVTVKD
jgi:hypothetical protein